MNQYPRETKEYATVSLTVNGDPVTGFQVSVAKVYDRPQEWTSVVSVDDGQAFLLDAAELGVGTYKVWARITDDPEEPVVEAGTFKIT